MAVVRLTRAIEFSTSLRYWNPDLSEEENRKLFGRKSLQHGHNYRLEVTLRGETDPTTGMVIDLKDLQTILDDEIMSRFDHRDLNRDTPYFDKIPATPENLIGVIRQLLVEALPAGLLDRLRLQQDGQTSVELYEERG